MSEVIEHNYPQGSPSWKRDRLHKNNASEAAAALACSFYMTRDQLLYAVFTGSEPEISPEQERIFALGHEVERKARPIAEGWLKRVLYPVVLSTAWPGIKRPLGASYDGLVEPARRMSFECKALNAELRQALPAVGWEGVDQNDARRLPKMYRVQMESQQMVARTVERTLFMAAEFQGDKLVDCRLCWYVSDPELRQEIVDGWIQFEADLATYVVPDVKPAPPVGNKVAGTLPALIMEVRGEVIASNLIEWETAALAKVGSVISVSDLKSDQDFADAKEAVKWCESAEDELKLAKKLALARMATVDQLFASIDKVVEQLATKRRALDNGVKARRETRVKEIVDSGISRLAEHVKACEARILALVPEELRVRGALMPRIEGDFWGAVRSKKSFSSMESGVNDALAAAKVEANRAAQLREANLREIAGKAPGALQLFNDWEALITKDCELVAMTVQQRLDEERKRKEAIAEAARLAALPKPTPEPTPAPTAAPFTPIAAAAPAPVANALPGPSDHDRVNDEGGRRLVDAFGPRLSVQPEPQVFVHSQPEPQLSTEPTLKAGDITARFGFSLTLEFIEKICGVTPTVEGTRRLFSEEQFNTICVTLQQHIENVRVEAQAGAAPKAPGEIEMQPVKSAQLAAVGYDADTKTLAVEFARGGLYHYADVPPSVFGAMLAASSVGSYFAANVRSVFLSTKIA